jgi:hypothetical protein
VQGKAGYWYHVLRAGIESIIKRKTGRWGTYSVSIREDTWKRMGEITPGRYEHTTRWCRETRVPDNLEECQRQPTAGGVTCYDNMFRFDGTMRCPFWGSNQENIYICFQLYVE